MKCKYCGYNISLEEEYCPHCGNKNEEAAKHIADMEQYGIQPHFRTAEALNWMRKGDRYDYTERDG